MKTPFLIAWLITLRAVVMADVRKSGGFICVLRDPGLPDHLIFTLESLIAICLVVLFAVNVFRFCRTKSRSAASGVLETSLSVRLAKHLGVTGGTLLILYFVISVYGETGLIVKYSKTGQFAEWLRGFWQWIALAAYLGLFVLFFGLVQYYLFCGLQCMKKTRLPQY